MERLNQLLKKYKIEIVCNNCGSPSSKIQKRKNKLGKGAVLRRVAKPANPPAFTRLLTEQSNNKEQSDLKELFTFKKDPH
jgi:hypothetical protein